MGYAIAFMLRAGMILGILAMMFSAFLPLPVVGAGVAIGAACAALAFVCVRCAR